MTSEPWQLQLRRARKARGWTQSQLAGRVHPPLAASTISRIERGKLDPQTSTTQRIAAALGYDLGLRPTPATALDHAKRLAADLAIRHHADFATLLQAIVNSVINSR